MNNQLKYLLFLMLVPLFLFAQGGISEGQELITNNSFDDGLTNWNLYVNSACDATVDIDSTNQLTGEKCAHVRVNTLSGSTKRDYHIQFYQNLAEPNGIRPGYKYYLQYQVKTNRAINDFYVKVHMAHSPWLAFDPKRGYLGRALEANKVISIQDSLEFTDTDDQVKLSFDVGLISDANVDIWIDEVHLIEVKKEVPEDDKRKNLPDGTEMLTNNYFDNGLTNWELYSLESSRAEYELDTNSVITGKNCVHITVHNPYKDTPSGRIQLNQHNIPGGIIEGKYYFVSFNLKANKDIKKCFWTIYKEPDYKNYYNWDWVKAKKDSITHFSFRFKAKKTDNSVYFAIDFATLRNDNTEIWIDDFHLIAVADPIAEQSLPRAGNELLNNNYFDNGLNNWKIIANEDAAEISLSSNFILEGKNSAYIKVNKASTDNAQQIRLYQDNLLDSVKVGNEYHIQFIAKASKAVSGLYWSINQQNAPHETLYSKEISLPEDEIIFVTDTIPAFSSNEKVFWSFDLGTVSLDNVDIWFDAVHLMELGKVKEPIFPPETTWNPKPPEALEKPKYLQSIQDPQHGVYYTRISDPTVFGISSGSTQLLSNYPKIQAWNADMSIISLVFGTYLLDGEDYSIYKKSSTSLYERRWSNVDPKTAYFCDGNKFEKINVETEQITILHTFAGYKATIGPWEGSISADDKYVVITNESGGVPIEASLYDIETSQVISTKSFSGDIDWISITPSGNYIVVNDRGNQKMDVYDLNFNYLRTIGIGSQHGDFGVDSEGNEVWVQVIPLGMSRLSDGKFTRLLQPNIGGHISGRGFNNPGWALVSTDINGEFNYTTQLFEIKLDGSGTIRHFGYARTSCTTYDNYPMGSVSRDGKRVIFNSDWKYGTGSGGNALAYISEYKERTTDVEKFGNQGRLKMDFSLSQNYPNPFNPTTTINYRLNKDGMTKLVVYNVLGKQVKVLINEQMRAGSYSTPFDGSNLSSGVYFYKLQTNNQVQIKKMLLIK